MNNNYLVHGSLAWDSILIHKGEFQARILPKEIARLNVSFGVDEHREEFGGTAGNIVYNASLMGDHPMLIANLGTRDGADYERHLKDHKCDVENITWHEGSMAHAWILTDEKNNQISAFSPGVMARKVQVPESAKELKVWHLAPESASNTKRMVMLAQEWGVPYILDPGQSLPDLMGIEKVNDHDWNFKEMVMGAEGLFLNEYETQLMESWWGASLTEIFKASSRMEWIVQTLGGKGLKWITREGEETLKSYPVSQVIDPTGCGDSLRAGFLYGKMRGLGLKESLAWGSALASFVVESCGGQNHQVSLSQVQYRKDQLLGFCSNECENQASRRASWGR